jgi:hypothetical protein
MPFIRASAEVELVGVLGPAGFALSGQVLSHHWPSVGLLEAGEHMMYVSRHIYLLGVALVNLMLGLYLQPKAEVWRRRTQAVGSILLLSSPFFLGLAFVAEPGFGIAGRSWRTEAGLFTLWEAQSRTSLRAVAARRIDSVGCGL